MPYGTVKVDNITFDQGGADQNVTTSGIYRAITSGVTVTGTISGAVLVGTTTVSGATVTGTTVQGTTVQGVSGAFTSLTGTTTTGTTANFVSGVFTTRVSGATITGTTAQFTSGTFVSLTGTTITGTTISGTTVSSTTGTFISLTGTTITGTTVNGTTVNSTTGNFTSLTGVTVTGITVNFVSGVFTTQVSGLTVTGTQSSFTSGNFVTLSGATATFTSGVIASGTAAAPSLSILGYPNTGIYSPGANQVAISTNGTGRLFVDAGGNIGVGTSSPFSSNGTNLHVLSTGTARLWLQSTAASTGRQFYLESLSTGGLTFSDGTAGQERMRLDSSGRLGLGTSSVSSKLHIRDAHTLAAASQIALIENTTVGEPASLAFLAVADNAGASNQGAIYFDAGADGATPDNKLQFTAAHQSSITPQMTLNGSGQLGIGIASPSSLLHTQSAGQNATNLVSTGSSVVLNMQCADTGSATINAGGSTNPDKGRILYSDNSDFWGFYTTDTERMRLDSSGRLGIGTSSPGSPLHVKANSTEGIRIESIDFTGIYGLLTSRRSSGTPLDIAAIHSVGSLAPEISFSRSTNGSTFTESARINSSGKLLVGTSSNSGGATIQAIGSVQASIALRFPANNKNGGTTKPTAIETISTDGGTNTATVYANNRYGSGKWVFLAGFDSSGNAINSTTSTAGGATFVFSITDAATNFPAT